MHFPYHDASDAPTSNGYGKTNFQIKSAHSSTRFARLSFGLRVHHTHAIDKSDVKTRGWPSLIGSDTYLQCGLPFTDEHNI